MDISRLARGLSKAGLEPDLEELRDILWLAERITSESGNGPAQLVSAEVSAASVGHAAATATATTTTTVQGSAGESAQRHIPTDSQQADAKALYCQVPGQTGRGAAAGLLRVRGVRPLPEPMAIGRALRPLSRKRAGDAMVMDEQATVERIAATGVRDVVYRPALERWFDIVILAEQVHSMVAWRPVLQEFERLLQLQRGFRTVRTLELKVQHGVVAAVRPDGAVLTAPELADRTGRRLLLIASDCTSAPWRDGRMGDWIKTLSSSVPVSIAQFLPRALWPNTAIGFAELHARSLTLAAPTARLQIRRPGWAVGEPGIAVPVFSMTPKMVSDWVRMTVSAGNAWAVAALVPLPEAEELARASATGLDSRARIDRFRASATPEALELAAYFSVVKPLTPPVMRVIQSALAPSGDAVALAQIFLGGLLYPVPIEGGSGNPDHTAYEFHAGLREILIPILTTRQFVDVHLALHSFLQELSGTPFDFFALFADPEGSEQLPLEAQPFAIFSRELASRFGMAPTAARERRVQRVATMTISSPLQDRLMFSFNGGHVILELLPGRMDVIHQTLDRANRKPDIDLTKKLATMFAPAELVRELRIRELDEFALCELVLEPALAIYPWEIAFSDDGSRVGMFAVALGFTRRVQLDVPAVRIAEHGGIVIALEDPVAVTGPTIYDLRDKAEAIERILQPVADEVAKTVGLDPLSAAKWMETNSFRFAHVVMRDEAPPLESRELFEMEQAHLAKLFFSASRIPEFIFFERPIGASHVIELLRAGVRVIVEPVSNVSAEETLAFATTLYEHLSEGRTLIEAVRDARRSQAALSPKPGLRAFACYGDADWSLAGRNEVVEVEVPAPPRPAELKHDNIGAPPEAEPPAAWPFPTGMRPEKELYRVKVFISKADYKELGDSIRRALSMSKIQLRFVKDVIGGKKLGLVSPTNLRSIRHSELVLCIVGDNVEFVAHERMGAFPRTLAESVYEEAQKQHIPVEILVRAPSPADVDERMALRRRLLDKKYVTPYETADDLIWHLRMMVGHLLSTR